MWQQNSCQHTQHHLFVINRYIKSKFVMCKKTKVSQRKSCLPDVFLLNYDKNMNTKSCYKIVCLQLCVLRTFSYVQILWSKLRSFSRTYKCGNKKRADDYCAITCITLYHVVYWATDLNLCAFIQKCMHATHTELCLDDSFVCLNIAYRKNVTDYV
jgi:hypothetical protein